MADDSAPDGETPAQPFCVISKLGLGVNLDKEVEVSSFV
jgi:hypothetical protein